MAGMNRSLSLEGDELERYRQQCLTLDEPASLDHVRDRVICQDLFAAMEHLPAACADLLFVDPPYNLTKSFRGTTFQAMAEAEYESYVESWLVPLLRLLKPDGSVYICADWRCSAAVHRVVARYLMVRNRITWEREKGRGALTNWKNASEDIWFCTASSTYHFAVEEVKLRRVVRAPYRQDGRPKDWEETSAGNFRDTHPSNLWTDLTVPFWSMPENTEHPTQKPEKLLAKLLLASCPVGGLVLDPFAGVGTSAVVARKLDRHFIAVEIEPVYCALAMKRLALAAADPSIQGYADQVFWERNTLDVRQRSAAAQRKGSQS